MAIFDGFGRGMDVEALIFFLIFEGSIDAILAWFGRGVDVLGPIFFRSFEGRHCGHLRLVWTRHGRGGAYLLSLL